MLALTEMLRLSLPWFGIDREVIWWRFRNLPNFWRGFWRIALARLFGLPHMYGQLSLILRRGNGEIVDYGLASLRVITDIGAQYIVNAWVNTVELELMKFHGFGTNNTAENTGQTGLIGELTTQYATSNTRPSGTPAVGGSANIVRTIATLTPTANVALVEHGIFEVSGSGVGNLFDRSVFATINLVSATGDSLQATYECTFVSGG